MINLNLILILSVVAGILYRLGGKQGFNTLFRDLGTNVVMIATMIILGVVNSLPLLSASVIVLGTTWGALSTYRYFLPKPKDYGFLHYFLHGFMVALAALPIAIVRGNIWGMFALRCVVCGILVGFWSTLISVDDLEEFGRGFAMNATLIILCIG